MTGFAMTAFGMTKGNNAVAAEGVTHGLPALLSVSGLPSAALSRFPGFSLSRFHG
jgi:hypothetical protein